MYSIIFYSHSDYSDVWPPLFAQTEKYLPGIKKYLFSDQSTDDLDSNWNLIKYDDSMSYQERVVSCLKKVEEDIILFHHEDMFLFDSPKFDKLEQLISLVRDGEIDIIKLARASYHDSHPLVNNTKNKDVYENPYNLKFAIQPSICNKEKLELIYSKTYGNDIWEFESNSSTICEYFKIKTGMTWEPEDNKRGLYHWDSGIYPYFATAVVKGKWNLTEYGDLLLQVLEDNDVNTSIRGVV